MARADEQVVEEARTFDIYSIMEGRLNKIQPFTTVDGAIHSAAGHKLYDECAASRLYATSTLR